MSPSIPTTPNLAPALPAVTANLSPEALLEGRPEQRVPMSRLRARVAERLLQSQATNAILTTFNEVNMAPVMEMRKKFQDLPQYKGRTVELKEKVDEKIIGGLRSRGLRLADIALLPAGNAWLMVEYGADTREDALAQARALAPARPHAMLSATLRSGMSDSSWKMQATPAFTASCGWAKRRSCPLSTMRPSSGCTTTQRLSS